MPPETSKKHMVPLRMNEAEWTMTELKAAVYHRGNVSALLRDAVQAYQGPLPTLRCFHCHAPLAYAFDGTVEWETVTITGVPSMTCPQCGDRSYDMAVLEALETAVEGKNGTIEFPALMQLGTSNASD